jgi:hypothetical protein
MHVAPAVFYPVRPSIDQRVPNARVRVAREWWPRS